MKGTAYRRVRTLVLAASVVVLTSCGQNDAPAPEPTGRATPKAAVTPVPTVSAAPLPSGTPTEGSGIPEFGIPVALQGNWGMVPADCTSTRGDAKGLLRISGTTLTFYESVGRLGTVKERSDKSIRADFGFSGEGMTWTRGETLTVSNDDKRLTRTESGGEEPGGPFTYKKCQ
jgi:hypothetical protein